MPALRIRQPYRSELLPPLRQRRPLAGRANDGFVVPANAETGPPQTQQVQQQQVQQQHAQQPAPVRKPAPAQTPSSGSSCLSNTVSFLVVGYIGIHALPLLMLVFTHFMFFGLMAWAVFLMFIMVYAASRR